MPNKLGKKNGQLGEFLPFALAVSNNQIAQSNLHQPDIRKASACAPDASVRHIPMLCPPKLSRGASQCATEAPATGVAMLRDFRVGGGTGISPISRTRKAILCRMRRAAVRHLPISAPGAQEEAIWWFLVGIPVRLFGEMAPGGKKQETESSQMAKLRFCGADEARARASAGISRNPRYPPPPKAAAPSGGGCRSFETAAKQERRLDRMVKSPFCGADEARTRDPRRDRPVF